MTIKSSAPIFGPISATALNPAMNEPKSWDAMSPEERAPILMAHRCGCTIQFQRFDSMWHDDTNFEPEIFSNLPYRIKPRDE